MKWTKSSEKEQYSEKDGKWYVVRKMHGSYFVVIAPKNECYTNYEADAIQFSTIGEAKEYCESN